MSSDHIPAIVLNWNRKDDTLATLRTLQEQRGVEIDLVVVDNGSTDDSVIAVRTQFPDALVIETGANLGYAAGNNVGLKYALERDYEYVFLVNNDTELDSKCIAYLCQDLQQHPDAAAVAPKSFFFDAPETLYFDGGEITSDGRTLHVSIDNHDKAIHDLARQVDWLTGCAILFRSEALRGVGLFDPRYYLLYEDADWSLRAKKAGYQLRFVPEAKLWHKVSSSFGKTWSPGYVYYYTRNSLLWIEQNFLLHQKLRLYFFALRRAFGAAFIRNRSPSAVERCRIRHAVGKGLVDYIFRRFGAIS